MKKNLKKTLETLKSDLFKPLTSAQKAKIIGGVGTDKMTKIDGSSLEVVDQADC